MKMPVVKITSKTWTTPLHMIERAEIDIASLKDLQSRIKKRKPEGPPTLRIKPRSNLLGEILIRTKCDRCSRAGWISITEADKVLCHGAELACTECLNKDR